MSCFTKFGFKCGHPHATGCKEVKNSFLCSNFNIAGATPGRVWATYIPFICTDGLALALTFILTFYKSGEKGEP